MLKTTQRTYSYIFCLTTSEPIPRLYREDTRLAFETGDRDCVYPNNSTTIHLQKFLETKPIIKNILKKVTHYHTDDNVSIVGKVNCKGKCNEYYDIIDYLKIFKKEYKKIEKFYFSGDANLDNRVDTGDYNIEMSWEGDWKGFFIIQRDSLEDDTFRKPYKYQWRFDAPDFKMKHLPFEIIETGDIRNSIYDEIPGSHKKYEFLPEDDEPSTEEMNDDLPF